MPFANLRQVSTVGAPQARPRPGAVGREPPEVHRAPVNEGRQTVLDAVAVWMALPLAWFAAMAAQLSRGQERGAAPVRESTTSQALGFFDAAFDVRTVFDGFSGHAANDRGPRGSAIATPVSSFAETATDGRARGRRGR